MLSCNDKYLLTLVQSRSNNRLWLRFRKYTTVFTLCVDCGSNICRFVSGMNNFPQLKKLFIIFVNFIVNSEKLDRQIPNHLWEAGLVQSSVEMIPQLYFIAIHDIKSKHFSNTLRDSSVYIISCIRQPVAQELNKIHFLVYMRVSFVDLLREPVS